MIPGKGLYAHDGINVLCEEFDRHGGYDTTETDLVLKMATTVALSEAYGGVKSSFI